MLMSHLTNRKRTKKCIEEIHSYFISQCTLLFKLHSWVKESASIGIRIMSFHMWHAKPFTTLCITCYVCLNLNSFTSKQSIECDYYPPVNVPHLNTFFFSTLPFAKFIELGFDVYDVFGFSVVHIHSHFVF